MPLPPHVPAPAMHGLAQHQASTGPHGRSVRLSRRDLLLGGLCSATLVGAPPALALGADMAVLIVPDARALTLRRFTPAAGPLERHASRPGGWYALLYVPVAPQWPMQLLITPPERRHEIRLFALDAAPDEAPTVVDPMPLELERGRGGRAVARVSRFVLPASSTAPAIFVLLEQWHIDGDPPAPLSVQLLSQRAPEQAEQPWWSAHAGRATGVTPPPSPLTQQQRGPNAHQVPILSTPAMPGTGVWR